MRHPIFSTTLTLALLALPASAVPVTLTPGSSVTIGDTVVSCVSPAAQEGSEPLAEGTYRKHSGSEKLEAEMRVVPTLSANGRMRAVTLHRAGGGQNTLACDPNGTCGDGLYYRLTVVSRLRFVFVALFGNDSARYEQ